MPYDINGLNTSGNTNRARSLDVPKNGAGSNSVPITSEPNKPSHGDEKIDRTNGSDRVELSDTGKLMQKLSEKVGESTEVDQEKVNYFKGLLETNSYFINSKELAQNIFKGDN